MPRGIPHHEEIKSESDDLTVHRTVDDEGNELGTRIEWKTAPTGEYRGAPQQVVQHIHRPIRQTVVSAAVAAGATGLIEIAIHWRP